MPSDRAELRRLAETATQGLWETHQEGSVRVCSLHLPPDPDVIERVGDRGCRTVAEAEILGMTHAEAKANAAFIAAASPVVVLALLDEIARLDPAE